MDAFNGTEPCTTDACISFDDQPTRRAAVEKALMACIPVLDHVFNEHGMKLGVVMYPCPVILKQGRDTQQSWSHLILGYVWPRPIGVYQGFEPNIAMSVRVVDEINACFLVGDWIQAWARFIEGRATRPWLAVAMGWWRDDVYPGFVRMGMTVRPITDMDLVVARENDGVMWCAA